MMLAWVSVGALVLAVALSVLTKINVGIVSLAMAWLVGVYLGGMSVNTVLAGFPVPLLVTLVGVTLLFSMADTNGTLSRLTGQAVRLCRGNAGLLPLLFFALGVVVSTIGPGGTPASALPIHMPGINRTSTNKTRRARFTVFFSILTVWRAS